MQEDNKSVVLFYFTITVTGACDQNIIKPVRWDREMYGKLYSTPNYNDKIELDGMFTDYFSMMSKLDS